MKTQVITEFDIGIVLDHTQSSSVFTHMAVDRRQNPSGQDLQMQKFSAKGCHRERLDFKS